MTIILKFLKANWLLVTVIILALGVFAQLTYTQKQLDLTRTQLSISDNNAKAYEFGMKKWEDRYGQEHVKTIMFNDNLTNFKTSQDSITQKLISIIKDQGISLNKVRQAALINTKISTVLSKEILTRLPDTVVDLSNKDIKNIVTLSPYHISSEIELYNTQSIIATDSTYKIFLPHRYDFFLRRWFQEKRKETLVNMEVINSNPLIKTEQQKFIHIIK